MNNNKFLFNYTSKKEKCYRNVFFHYRIKKKKEEENVTERKKPFSNKAEGLGFTGSPDRNICRTFIYKFKTKI
jgi:hypothetical protein